MSERELELVLEGDQDRRDWFMQVLSWHAASIANTTGWGKKKFRPGDFLPADVSARLREHGRKDIETIDLEDEIEDPMATPKEKLERAKAKVRKKRAREEQENFRSSTEGRKLAKFFRDEDEERAR